MQIPVQCSFDSDSVVHEIFCIMIIIYINENPYLHGIFSFSIFISQSEFFAISVKVLAKYVIKYFVLI